MDRHSFLQPFSIDGDDTRLEYVYFVPADFFFVFEHYDVAPKRFHTTQVGTPVHFSSSDESFAGLRRHSFFRSVRHGNLMILMLGLVTASFFYSTRGTKKTLVVASRNGNGHNTRMDFQGMKTIYK
jgi:hypothetical protein